MVHKADAVDLRPSIDASSLADLFMKLYIKMFPHENVANLTSFYLQKASAPTTADRAYYTRGSLAIFLRLVKERIDTDWPQFMDLFLSKVYSDRTLIVGNNHLQELLCWLHLCKLYSYEFYLEPVRDSGLFDAGTNAAQSRISIVFEQNDPPHVTYVALEVPRKKLDPLMSIPVEKTGILVLFMMVTNLIEGFSNSFSAIHGFFGKLHHTAGQSFACTAEKDELGWQGSSDLVILAAVPTCSLVGNPKDIGVSLNVNPNPDVVAHLASKLGSNLEIFSAKLHDDRVKLLNQPPNSGRRPKIDSADLSDLTIKEVSHYVVELDSESVAKSLVRKISFEEDSFPSKLLRQGAAVSITALSPCALTVHVGSHQKVLQFPYPLNGSASRTRVARKSSWIEVIVPQSSAKQPGGYELQKFPVVATKGEVYQWSLSNVNLNLLPLVSRQKEPNFLSTFLGACCSNVEIQMNRSSVKSPMIELKESIHIILDSFLNGEVKAFTLVNSEGNGDTVIVANALRFDFDNASIVLDAYVVCMTKNRTQKMALLGKVLEGGNMCKVKMSRDEEALFKHMLPAMVERCRGTSWNHLQDCSYFKSDRVPLSTEHGQSAICSCGQGKTSELLVEHPHYRQLVKFMTRIALAPISTVGFVENLFAEVSKEIPADRLAVTAYSSSGEASAMLNCGHCGREGDDLKLCKRCGQARYCDKDCQVSAWKQHKKVCKPKPT